MLVQIDKFQLEFGMFVEAVKRIDALFDIEREINSLPAEQRLERRRKDSQPLVEALHNWLQTERAKLSRSSPVECTLFHRTCRLV